MILNSNIYSISIFGIFFKYFSFKLLLRNCRIISPNTIESLNLWVPSWMKLLLQESCNTINALAAMRIKCLKRIKYATEFWPNQLFSGNLRATQMQFIDFSVHCSVFVRLRWVSVLNWRKIFIWEIRDFEFTVTHNVFQRLWFAPDTTSLCHCENEAEPNYMLSSLKATDRIL